MRLDGLGLSVWNVDTFMIQPGVKIEEYRETLEIAALLGARTINALNLFPADATAAAAQTLGSFSKLAAQTGLTVVLEWFRYSSTKTLGAAVELIRLADEPNIRLNVDILHLIRNGGRPADLAGLWTPRSFRMRRSTTVRWTSPRARRAMKHCSTVTSPVRGNFLWSVSSGTCRRMPCCRLKHRSTACDRS